MFHAFSPLDSNRLYIETADPSDGSILVAAKIGDLAVAAWSEDRETDPSARSGVRVTNRHAWSSACDGCEEAGRALSRVVAVLADGARIPSRYCDDCLDLARGGWNPEITAVEAAGA